MIKAFENFKKKFAEAQSAAEFLKSKNLISAEIQREFDELQYDSETFKLAFELMRKYCTHERRNFLGCKDGEQYYGCPECNKYWQEGEMIEN